MQFPNLSVDIDYHDDLIKTKENATKMNKT